MIKVRIEVASVRGGTNWEGHYGNFWSHGEVLYLFFFFFSSEFLKIEVPSIYNVVLVSSVSISW